MKRFMIYGLLFTAFILSGCVMRITPREVDRVDQEFKGNRGIVRGRVADFKAAEKKKTKTIYDIEIELPFPSAERKQDIYPQGNKGYVTKSEIPERKHRTTKKKKSIIAPQRLAISETPQVIVQKPTQTEMKYAKEKGGGTFRKAEKRERVYVVKKGDTLQKISDKIYGTTKKWKKIYEANRDILESPDMIKPGQKLVIPLD